MITKEEALTTTYNQTLFNFKRRTDGYPVRVRVSGRCKVYRRAPKKFKLPITVGFNGHMHITELNCKHFYLNENDVPLC